MFNLWTVSAIIAVYLIILFAIAFWADRRKSEHQQHPLIYSLALGVHCTSWAFFGTTTQAAQYGWAFVPTYIGMILVFVLAFSVLLKIAKYCQTQQISSLADFIGSRYQNRFGLGVLVTLICFVGVVPYIALQLDAITLSLTLISSENTPQTAGIGLYVAGLMALFAILFGTRTLSLTEKHPGLMTSIAFESVLKLIGIVSVGVYVCFYLYGGPLDLIVSATEHPLAREVLTTHSAWWVYVCHILLGVCAAFCLPRQFHITFVENNGERELRTARWAFPLYLLVMTVFILPIALAGKMQLDPAQFSSDSFALAIPIAQQNSAVSVIAFIGGISAATSMVIVATLALGIMISNNLVTPIWLRFTLATTGQKPMPTAQILTIRRLTVLVVLSLAYAYHVNISQSTPLVQSGTIAIALLAQLMPAIVISLYWGRSHPLAAWLGILAGGICWFSWLLWPSITATYYFAPTPTDQTLGLGFVSSLAINFAVHFGISLLIKNTQNRPLSEDDSFPLMMVKVADLLALLQRVLPASQYEDIASQVGHSSQTAIASGSMVSRCEQLLAAQVGNAGARILLSTIATTDRTSTAERVELAELTSQTLQFNHEVLQSSVQHIQQGISVLDRDLTLLAWNDRYIEMFDYPSDFIKVGLPIRSILYANAQRGLFGDVDDIDAEIEKRISYMRHGSEYKYVRKQSDHKTIEINGSPLPNGGYVTTYSDISDYIRIQDELRLAKTDLENRVTQRTQQLEKARDAADRANVSKTKFLAAAGHDLLQPFNAAVLYASMLTQRANSSAIDPAIRDISQGIEQSLNSAESLLNTLLDMTKLESGVLQPNRGQFSFNDLMRSLLTEFSVIAQQKQVEIRYVPSQIVLHSDKKLLRRILQNLLSNAIRYAKDQGGAKVLIGMRRTPQSDAARIVVADNGIGIEPSQQRAIFDEFHQVNPHAKALGLGLGLTIVDRMATLLDHNVDMRSEFGRGTCFTITVPTAAMPNASFISHSVQHEPRIDWTEEAFLHEQRVLLIENDTQIQAAMSALLAQWGATVLVTDGYAHIEQVCPTAPDVMLVDFHLNGDETGTEAVIQATRLWKKTVPGILTTANRDDSIRELALNAGLRYLPKPVKPAALKRMLKQLLQNRP
ncbi:PAS domain-containing hybrid sensor histidine kinase/response regulator [Alteromonas oceanisediminis]|uniref:PAS domain-containing hybrid sensor histidine kinase/response regulator n=1 Tax=Alteromonas oceanisediminis TaxID=2836180 RepID=UPI001BDB423D|nr:PAS-domain containing protein [Alteromonas oceanisediminis]MBT0588077.1 PAS-domain containing protein [Alteromonas oceanisediminis]